MNKPAWEVTLSPSDVGAVPLNAYSIGGFSNMGQFAASSDGRFVAAAQGLRSPGVVEIQLTDTPTAVLYKEARLVTDQNVLISAGDPPGVFMALDSGREFALPVATGSNFVYRTAGDALLRGRDSSREVFSVELFTTGQSKLKWSFRQPGRLYGLAISADSKFVAVSSGNRDVIERVSVLDGKSGAELWNEEVGIYRAPAFGNDPLFFSLDGARVLLGTASEVHIYSSSTGKIEKRLSIGATALAGFDERLHSGFDGRYLWLFQYRAPRDRSDVFPSFSGKTGPVEVCGYAVFDVEENRMIRSERTAKEIDRTLIGKHTGDNQCNVRSVLPLADHGVLIVEYVSVDTLRIHRSSTIPGI